jgi:hypothetical protein
MENIFKQLVERYNEFVEKYKQLEDKAEIVSKANLLLDDIRKAGRFILDIDQRNVIMSLAREIGEIIFDFSDEYPSIRIDPPAVPKDTQNESERRRTMEKDDVLDKIKFELEMKRMFSEIEQLKKALESSRDGKEDGGHKSQQTLEKIKSDLEKLQKIVSDKDQDALKKEVDVVKKIMHSQNKKIEDLKDELEKSKKPPSDNKDQGMKSELEQIRKMLEDSQKGKLGSIQETLEKIQESLDKKSSAPPPAPSPAPSPDIQALKTTVEEIKKALDASKSDKVLDTLDKIKESVEKKPAPPPPPGENPLKGDIEQIKRAVEGFQTDTQKTFNIVNMVIAILIFIAMIVLIVLLSNGNIGRSKPTMEDLQNQMNELKDMIKKGRASKSDGAKKRVEVNVSGKNSSVSADGSRISLHQNDGEIDIQILSGNQRNAKGDVLYLRNNETAHIVSGQVLIKLSNLTDESALVELTLPNSKIYRMPDMKTGSRARFECKGETYFFDLMQINNSTAQIKVSKRA